MNGYLESYPIVETSVDRTLDGLSNVQEYRHREEVEGGHTEYAVWLPSCGGVSVGYQLGENLIARRSAARWATLLLRAVLAQRPSARTLFWNVVVNAAIP